MSFLWGRSLDGIFTASMYCHLFMKMRTGRKTLAKTHTWCISWHSSYLHA